MKVALITLVTGLLLGSVAFSAPISYFAILNGFNESPPNLSPGTGLANVTIDQVLNTMLIEVTFSGLTTGDTAAHIHCCIAPPGNAGVATTAPAFPGFPLGVTSGTYSGFLDMTLASSYNLAFVTSEGGTVSGAEAALVAGIASGQAYLNIHSSQLPGGEIRGFLAPTAPEPSTLLLAGAALASLALLRRRRQA